MSDWSAYYTQIEGNLYLINLENMIVVYDLTDISRGVNLTDIPYDGVISSCLTSSSSKLFVVGGSFVDNDVGVKNVNVYDIANDSWAAYTNILKEKRTYLSCAAHPFDSNILYAIGGATRSDSYSGNRLSSIEKINVSASNSSYTHGQLTKGLASTRTVTIKQFIYIIGGNIVSYDEHTKLVHKLDTQTDCVIASDELVYAVSAAAAVVASNFIFVFGGEINNGYLTDKWMFIQTTDSTRNPSNYPSADPTDEPTSDPSSDPTSNPSVSPTKYTNGPTPGSTLIPTFDPTIYPSFNPTFNPSISLSSTEPTIAPSTRPTSSLSASLGIPSLSPTFDPTSSPSLDIKSNPPTSQQDDTPIIVAFVIVGSFLFIIVLIFCLFVIRKVKKVHKEEVTMLGSSIEQVEKTRNQHLEGIEVPGSSQHIQLEAMSPTESTHGMSIDDVNNNIEIKKWLTNEVNLPEYYENFVSNGFESLDFICQIKTEQQLGAIGISLIGHRIRILTAINALKQMKNQEDEEGIDQVIEGNETINYGDNQDDFEVISDEDLGHKETTKGSETEFI